MADLAMGAAACVSFWRSLDFKAAVVMINTICLIIVRRSEAAPSLS